MDQEQHFAPLDLEEQLIAPPSSAAIEAYYHNLAQQGRLPGLHVKHIGEKLGKGVFAGKDFEGDDLVLREPMLVGAQHALNKVDALVCSHCFQFVGSIELQIGRRLFVTQGDLSTRESERECNEVSYMDTDSSDGTDEAGNGCDCAESPVEKKPISPELLKALLSGNIRLPDSQVFPLPPEVKCPGGCIDDVYCSNACADEAWEAYHCLLCTGPRSLCRDGDALKKFKEFADETNDVFHIAAQVIARTLLRARRIRKRDCDKSDGQILLEAWIPFAMGHKKLWWEAVGRPRDVDPFDDSKFRDQMKEIAVQSLAHLQRALLDEQFGALFSIKVYGHIIGMFEQNNLDIVVSSPVEDYFLYIDDLPPDAKAEAELITKPFLDALGSDYATFCRGSGFFAIQSCMNHSCQPNARAWKEDEDKDGQAVLRATRRISKFEEITISYVDEDEDDPEERQYQLADYGIVCSCPRCTRRKSQDHEE